MAVVYKTEARWSEHPLTIECAESGGSAAYRGMTPAGDYPASDGGLVAGISRFAADEGDQMTIHNDDEALVELSGTVTVGALLQFDTAGKAKAATAATVTGDTGADAHASAHIVAGGYLPQYAGWYAVDGGDADSIIRARKI
jgi:hypothetical protein